MWIRGFFYRTNLINLFGIDNCHVVVVIPIVLHPVMSTGLHIRIMFLKQDPYRTYPTLAKDAFNQANNSS